MRIVLASLFLLCASARAEAPAGDATLVATLERTGCYGTCPIYKIAVYTDGRVAWTGTQFVKVKGAGKGRITLAELEALRAAFTEADYFQLNEDYNCQEATDNPSVMTSYNDGHHQKAITHYHGCRSKKGVEALNKLEAKFDQIVKSSHWIGDGKD